MAKKIIQVPMDSALLKDLDRVCKKAKKPRAELVREACAKYLERLDIEEADRRYEESYRKCPESPDFGEAQVSMLNSVLEKEEWL